MTDIITEAEIVRIAQRVGMGQGESDIRELYVQEGKSVYLAYLAYQAAVTYLTIGDKPNNFKAIRASLPTRRDIPAVRL